MQEIAYFKAFLKCRNNLSLIKLPFKRKKFSNYSLLFLYFQVKSDLSEMKAQAAKDVQEIAYLKALLKCPSNKSSDQSGNVQLPKKDEECKFSKVFYS